MDKYTEKSKKAYNKKASNYTETFDYKFTKKLKRNFVEYLSTENIDGKNVLDIACGTGDLLNELHTQNVIVGTGIDIAENMIQEAEKLYGNQFQFQTANAEDISIETETQDVVLICCAFHHISNPTKVLSEVNRVLRKNGYLYIADFLFPPIVNGILNHIIYLIHNSGDVKMYSKKELERFCAETGFVVEKYSRIDFTSYIAKIKKP